MQTTNTVRVGSHLSNGCYVNGSLDEARIEYGARSSNWIWAAYMNVRSNAAFSSYSAVTQQVPGLSITGTGGNGLVLHWPASGVGFSLCTATNLNPPVGWTALTNSAVFANGQWQATLPGGDAGSRFYRLQPN
jgi:hypothetical protein